MGLLSFYFRKLIKIFRSEVLVLPSRVAVLVFVLFILLFPIIFPEPYYFRVIVLASIFAILAASWDLLSGFTGQMNFGHALFFGVGAYTSALLNLNLQIPPIASIPLGAVAAVLAGLIIGIPCLRLRGTYLALTTLAFPIILIGLVFAFPHFTGGELGVSGLSRLADSYLGNYYIVTVVMLVLVTVMWKITDSNIGVIFHAIREDEIAVRTSGINTIRYKLLAFSMSGFFAGIAGGLYAHYMRVAGPSTLEINTSFLVVIYAVFGGIATIYGPVGSVFVLIPFLEFLRFLEHVSIPPAILSVMPDFLGKLLVNFIEILPNTRMFIFAFFILMILLFMPDGLLPWVRDKVETECPRCKVRNVFKRKTCRICSADLH
ncbi:MAG: branched-chain amino acid ABC transporter permease [Deltaproteobacteria bacterium]|nr:branched-chain amino acid ABC transporter permease [Deltaproteobacteria bacterium]